MDGEKIKLSEAEILVHSETLNTAAQSINDTCKKIYNTITNLQESEAFKSKEAAMNYYLRIQEINAIVPKFIEGILKFSKFLSGYLIENYAETDELSKQIQESFNNSVEQLSAIGLIGGIVSLDKISSTAQGALNGNFINSDNIYKEAFQDTGSLEFVTRDDGAIMITRDGVPIGFTTKDGISNQTTSDTTDASLPSGMGNDPRYQQAGPSGMGDDPRYKNTTKRPETPLTGGMGNNEAILKARNDALSDSQKQYLDFQNSKIDSYETKNQRLNAEDSLWNKYIGQDISNTRTENKINAINSETEKILSGNAGLASEIIEKGSVPFPENSTLSKSGFNLWNSKTTVNGYKELRYNGTTGKVDVVLKDGTTSVSYDVEDLIGASFK